MKKTLLFILGFMFAVSAFAGGHFPMDGKVHFTSVENGYDMYFDISIEKHDQYPTMKYFIKPFKCKIWTNYEGDPGFGVKIEVYGNNGSFDGNYPQVKTYILTKDNPLELYVTYGIVTDVYNPGLIAFTENHGCSPLDSKCKIGDPPTIYESCSLTS
jgi:hypothetical protein